MQISVWSALQRWFSLGDITVVLALQVAAAACLTAVDVSTQATLATCSISSVTNFLTSPSGEHLLLRPGFAGTEGVKVLSLPSLQGGGQDPVARSFASWLQAYNNRPSQQIWAAASAWVTWRPGPIRCSGKFYMQLPPCDWWQVPCNEQSSKGSNVTYSLQPLLPRACAS